MRSLLVPATSALQSAKKNHRAVFIEDGSHQLNRKSDRALLLNEVEQFLLEHLGPGVDTGP